MTRFHRWFLYGSTATAATSGVVYFCLKRFFESADPWAVVNHPLEPWALRLHILSAPLMLFAVGLITTQHIWRSLRSSLPTGRRSGLIATCAFVPLAVGGYLIQIVTAPGMLEFLAWSHLALGLACAWALAAHRRVLRPRRLRRRPGALPIIRLSTTEATSKPASPPAPRRVRKRTRAATPEPASAGASRDVAETRGQR